MSYELPNTIDNSKQIILFDGICNFCNFWINWLLLHDKKEVFVFASLQSTVGQELLKTYFKHQPIPDSIVLISDSKLYTKSKAVLLIVSQLDGIYKYFAVFLLKLKCFFLYDFFYIIIAKMRYQIFGKRDTCRFPTENEKKRFLA